jgi:PAS domain S-box-containing protein
MSAVHRILHLEDNARDAELVREELSLAGDRFNLHQVHNRASYEAAVVAAPYDLIISDFDMPAYDGMAALAFARIHLPEVPFILVTGALGEERAVQCLRAGTTDYVLKDDLGRLLPTILTVLAEADERCQRRDMEAALRDKSERLLEQAEMLDQAHDSIVLTDLEGRILYWSAGAERLYGWTAEEMVGHVQDEFCSPDESEFLQNIRGQTIETGFWRGQMELMNKEGKLLLIETHRTLTRDSDGNPKGVLAISNDITEQKRLETQLLRAQRMESIGTLAGGIAHDLNNVLGPILLSLPLLRDSLKDERDLQLLDQMEATAQRGAAIVRQVLSFARGVDGERTPVQVRHLINETLKILGETFPKSIHLDFNGPRDIWLVHGDPTQIQQVLMNLCVNARDAMGDDGHLTVDAENVVIDDHYSAMHVDAQCGPYVVLRVTDTGTGIPESIREKIFDPFFTTKELGKGTGLGLSTVTAIVKSHGGFVSVYSEMGKGTTFKVYLPADAVSKEEQQETQSRELPRGHGETILVVDDEQTILRAVQRSLERHGYKVLTAKDGAEALAVYVQEASHIALVLTDMMMPVLDGAAAARALMSINPKVKIVMSSGLATNGGVIKASQVGVKHFLAKPYTIDAVLKIIRQVIDEPAE